MMTKLPGRTLFLALPLVLTAHLGCGDGEKASDAALAPRDGASPDVKQDAAITQPDVAPLAVDVSAADVPQTLVDAPIQAVDTAPVWLDAAASQLDTGVAIDGRTSPLDGAITTLDGAAAAIDGPAVVYSCGAFALGSEWTTAAGFRSAIVAKDGLLGAPIALTFAGGAFGSGVYVADQGSSQVLRLDDKTGTLTAFVASAQWPKVPSMLTNILWDSGNAFDGNLYVGDQGGNSDGDSTVYRVSANGTTQVFAAGPGPGLDDVFGMAFSPGGAYPSGLYLGGDTDGTGPGLGVYSTTGSGAIFASFAGIEGLAVDTSGRFGGGLFATMPASGGYSGNDTLTRIKPDGTLENALVSGVPGIHAIAFAPAGPFGGDAYVASWDSQKILRVKPNGTTSDLATGLSLTNYDGNILAFSPDGRVLFVADRSNHRIVCIEPTS